MQQGKTCCIVFKILSKLDFHETDPCADIINVHDIELGIQVLTGNSPADQTFKEQFPEVKSELGMAERKFTSTSISES